MRRRYPVLVLAILLVAIALSASLVVANAGATPTWTCGSCHAQTATHDTHGVGTATGVACDSCHVNGVAEPPTPAACASCHTTLPDSHPAGGGCFATGCHAAPSPTPTPTPTDTETPTPTPTPTETSTSTPTPTPTPSATENGGGGVGGETDEETSAVGFPTTGYPPSSGGSAPWPLITGLFVGGATLLFAAWRLRAAAARQR